MGVELQSYQGEYFEVWEVNELLGLLEFCWDVIYLLKARGSGQLIQMSLILISTTTRDKWYQT